MCDYVITNGINYLAHNGGNWCIVGTPSKAEKFSLTKANNYLKNSVPKWMKVYNLKVQEYVPSEDSISVEPEDIDSEIKDIINRMTSDLQKYKTELEKTLLHKVTAQLKYIQAAQQDLEHLPEEVNRTGKDLDMYGGYLFYKDFQGLRIQRRKLKNQKEKIEALMNINIADIINNQVNEIDNKFNKRTYSARVHNGLVDLYKSHGCLCDNKVYKIKVAK